MLIRAKWLAVSLIVALLAPAGAAPTPVPGGANSVAAVAGKLGETVFNGVLRIKIVALREATDADHAELAARSSDLTPTADKKLLVMQSLLRNGVHADFIDLVRYTLADKDDVSVEIPDHLVNNVNLHILQAAAGAPIGCRPRRQGFRPRQTDRAVRDLRRPFGLPPRPIYDPAGYDPGPVTR